MEVRGGRIVRVHRGAPEAGLPVLDAGGKTLIPGLVDNHAHYWFPFQGERLVARGITSVRDPGRARQHQHELQGRQPAGRGAGAHHLHGRAR